jgi:hypothetical protein
MLPSMGALRLPTEVAELLSAVGGLRERTSRPALSSHSIRVGSVSSTVLSHCNVIRRRWAVMMCVVTIAGSSRFSSASIRGVGGGGVNRSVFADSDDDRGRFPVGDPHRSDTIGHEFDDWFLV